MDKEGGTHGTMHMVAQKMLRTNDVLQVFSEEKLGFDDSFDVTKCLSQKIFIPYVRTLF